MKKLTWIVPGLVMMSSPAFAQAMGAGQIADNLRSQVTSISYFISVAAFVLGLGMAIAGLMKFHANSKNPNDPSNKMSTAFILIFVGSGLVALPSVLGSGIATIFGSGAATTDAVTGFSDL